jgi:hypothetical protein
MDETPPDETDALRERAKELRCLYRIHAIVSGRALSPEAAFERVLEALPEGWQRPGSTGASIEYLGRRYVGPGYTHDGACQTRPITLWGTRVGALTVSSGASSEGAPDFLAEELELLSAVAARLGEYLEWKQTELLAGRTSRAADHWRWRHEFAEALARRVDAAGFEIDAIYLGGSTGGGDAGPGSDIDLWILCRGDGATRERLAAWVDGFGACTSEVAHRQTGYRFPAGLIDLHWLDAPPTERSHPGLRSLPLGPPRG